MSTAPNSFEAAMTGAADFLAQSLKSLLGTVFTELSQIASPDIGSSGFLSTYAAGSGIAMFVLVVMLGRIFYRTSSGDMSGQALAESLWRWAPTALLLVLFGPGLGQLVVQLTDAASQNIVGYFGADVRALTGQLTGMVVIDDPATLPGGPLLALLVMAVAFVGVLGIVGGLVIQTLVLYLTGAVMSVAFVAMIDPALRARALRLPATWLALLLAKPLLFFMIGAIARISGSALAGRADGDAGWRHLMPALLGAAALLLVGFLPWSLLRLAPRLPAPSGDRVARVLCSGAAARENAPSSTMMQMSYRRLHGIPAGLAGQTAAVARPGAMPRPGGGIGRITTGRAHARHAGHDPTALPAAPAYAAEPAADNTAVTPFGEQAIDAAPPVGPMSSTVEELTGRRRR